MFSTWTRHLLKAGLVTLAAVMVVALSGWAGQDREPTVDAVLDNPQRYVGQDVRLEGEVDHIYSSTTFAMEDDQDLFGEDEILIISVMPAAARSTSTQSNTTQSTVAPSDRNDNPAPVVELLELIDGEFREGKLVAATGTIRMFDRAALEQEYGPLNLGSAPVDKFENEPVLLVGAREFAQYREQPEPEQQAAVVEPEPLPEPVPEPEPEAAPVEPAPEPEPAVEPEPEPEPQAEESAIEQEEPERELPRTATPLPIIGIAGLLSLLLGFAIRAFRT